MKTASCSKSIARILLLALTIVLFSTVGAFAAEQTVIDAAVQDTAAYIYKTVAEPQIASVGGEWAVLGLARSNYNVPDTYYQQYFSRVEALVTECKGVISEHKYTDYARLIIALTAIGKDARDISGYDLTIALADYEKIIKQGLNGPIWALIALDSANYPIPQDNTVTTQATRQMYIDYILANQASDGSWAMMSGGTPDLDITGMALQALAKYQDQAAVASAIDQALAFISANQSADGGFASWGDYNTENIVQLIVALGELNISLDDTRFVKNGSSMADALLSFYVPKQGFLHSSGDDVTDLMSTEQALYALVSIQRQQQGLNSLYRLDDALTIAEANTAPAGSGLPGKHQAVTAMAITLTDASFDDIGTSPYLEAIEALAARGIVTGNEQQLFTPEADMTRAEFCAIVVRALGLSSASTQLSAYPFTDVAEEAWYFDYVYTAYFYELVNGIAEDQFNPAGLITREEAAVMVARAAALCGMNTALDDGLIRNTLAQFSDYVSSSSWARAGLAFCYQENILDQSDIDIRPATTIKRGEMAQMLFNLLHSANLL